MLFLDSEVDSVRGALDELKTFSDISGLKINIGCKTSCMTFGDDDWNKEEENLGISWAQEMKTLGIVFPTHLDGITEINVQPKLVQIDKEIMQWKRWYLTPFGRIMVFKSLLFSKLVNLFVALPNPPGALVNVIERKFFHFIWGSKRDSIKRNRLTQRYANGGL